METRRLFHFSASPFGHPFEAVVVEACRRHGMALTLVLPDPVNGMGPIRRRRTRTTRPIRRCIEVARRRREVWLVEDVNDASFVARIPCGAHGLITGYTQIFRQPAIDRFDTFVNVHPSLLPYYRGGDPFHWLEVNGEQRSGYTLHEVTEAIDAGPVVFQEVVELTGTDPWWSIVHAARPTVGAWISHIAAGTPFPHRQVDAASVYHVHLAYGPLLESRRRGRPLRGKPATRPAVRLPPRIAALRDIADTLSGRNAGVGPLRSSWPALLRLAGQEQVVGAIARALREERDTLPPTVADELRLVHRADVVRNLRFRRQLIDALKVLGDAGIVPLVFKGALALLEAQDNELGARWMVDLDLAVAPRDASAAIGAFEAAGYTASPMRAFGYPHEVALHRTGMPGPIELHTELGVPPLAVILPLSEVLADSTEITVDVGSARRMSPTHQFLHSVLHSALQDRQHAVAGLPLRHLLDLVAIAEARGPELDWGWMIERARAHGRAAMFRDHLWLAHQLFGLALPPELPRTAGMRVHETACLLSFAMGWPPKLRLNMSEVFDREYLEHIYGHGGSNGRLAVARIRHAIAVTRDHGFRTVAGAAARR